jgi:ubiquinone/menaquinone biosynthesis C-methylase UbiE
MLPDSAIITNLQVKPGNKKGLLFEKTYIQARALENRLYSDTEVASLPVLPQSHPNAREWQMRRKSADDLIKYLTARKRALSILEVGCGNGWLSNRLAAIKHSRVTGQDINFTELQQAARVFSGRHNLSFTYGDLFDGIFRKDQFDAVIFASSIQYFPSLTQTICLALGLLRPQGELHIIDSHFYKQEDIPAAQQRTLEYYQKINSPALAGYYFHHAWQELALFRYQLKYDPNSAISRLRRHRSVFPWIYLNKD